MTLNPEPWNPLPHAVLCLSSSCTILLACPPPARADREQSLPCHWVYGASQNRPTSDTRSRHTARLFLSCFKSVSTILGIFIGLCLLAAHEQNYI